MGYDLNVIIINLINYFSFIIMTKLMGRLINFNFNFNLFKKWLNLFNLAKGINYFLF